VSTGATPLVERTRRLYTALNLRDFDVVMAMFAPTAVWDVSRWGLGTHSGLKAIRQFLEDWFGKLEHYEVHVEELEDLGNGVVFAVVTQLAQQTRRRAALRVRSAPVYMWVDERIALITVYPGIEEGRAAAARAASPSSQRNLEVHRDLLEAVTARRATDTLLAPGFFIESRMTPATDYKYHGAAGLREWGSDLLDAFIHGARLAIEEVIAASDDFVVATLSVAGRGAHAREPLELRWVGVMWFANGKATRVLGYASRPEALKAVGLAE
jgi:ketosteroid isomerase-like protein